MAEVSLLRELVADGVDGANDTDGVVEAVEGSLVIPWAMKSARAVVCQASPSRMVKPAGVAPFVGIARGVDYEAGGEDERVEEPGAANGAVDRGEPGVGHGHAGRHRSVPVVSARQRDHGLVIDPGVGHAAKGTYLNRTADGKLGEPVAVDPHVEGCAASLLGVEEPRRGVWSHAPADVGGGQSDRSEVAAFDHLMEDVELWQIAGPHGFGSEHAG